ncbi:MAG: hypothetical protein MOB07_04420 [Acidobacteria bacterium]|nr:hypothetical protein [Acidobacteriota bacterium]
MEQKNTLTARFILPVIILLLCALIPALQGSLEMFTVATGQSRLAKSGKGLPKEEKKSNLASGAGAGYMAPVMWREPANLERRDLFYGPGGRAGAPNPAAKYTFIRHSESGTQKKIIVKDDRGREWTVKFGREARPETTATRIVWAVGYHADQDYFVKRAYIGGKETFDAQDVRFERRDDGYNEVDTWSWKDNPLIGTRELDGLKVLMALLKNWDLKTSNNEIVRHEKTGQTIYYIADLGASFGRTGSWLNKVPIFADMPPDKAGGKHGKGDPEAFTEEDFIEKVRNGEVIFHFERSRGRSVLKGVSVTNARWMGSLLGRLSNKQLTDAFRAGGFNQDEVAVFVRTMRTRINQLQKL